MHTYEGCQGLRLQGSQQLELILERQPGHCCCCQLSLLPRCSSLLCNLHNRGL